MNETYELTLNLPILAVGNERMMRDLITSFSHMVDRSFVPNNRLPVVAFIDLGFVGNPHDESEDNYGFIYSPAMMGRTLSKISDRLYIMNHILEQWNLQYQKQYKTNEDMPYTYFVGWNDVCDDWGFAAQDLYESWLAQRIKTRIEAEMEYININDHSIKKI